MPAFVIFHETDFSGTPRGSILVNVDSIIRVTPQGSNHCAMLTRSFTAGHETAAAISDGVTSSRFFVSGTLQEVQIKLNCAVA